MTSIKDNLEAVSDQLLVALVFSQSRSNSNANVAV